MVETFNNPGSSMQRVNHVKYSSSISCDIHQSASGDIVYLYSKLEKLSEKINQLEDKLSDVRMSSSLDHTKYLSLLNSSSESDNVAFQTLENNNCNSAIVQSSLLKFVMPPVITVTAIVINLYLYVSSVRKFPF